MSKRDEDMVREARMKESKQLVVPEVGELGRQSIQALWYIKDFCLSDMKR